MQAEKLKILEDVFGDYRVTGSEFLFLCPRCKHHKLKLSINISKDCFKCWVCSYSGIGIRRIVQRHGGYEDRKAWAEFDSRFDISEFEKLLEEVEEEKEQTLKLPTEFKSLATPVKSHASIRVRNYLHRRGLTDIDIVNWKIGYCGTGQYEERIIIPSFNKDGYVNFFVARSYEDHWKKYMNPKVPRNNIVFNELFLDFATDLVIVEGAFDAIKAGLNSVPLLGSTLSNKSKLLKEIVRNDTPVYLALDSDAERKSIDIIKELLKYGLEVHKIDTRGYSDVGEMSKETFQKKKQEALLINSDNFLSYQLSRV